MEPRDYWASYEEGVGTLAEFFEAVQRISAYGSATGTRFVWRGAAKADWPLHSSLVRRFIDTHGGDVPTENELRSFERSVLAEARDWDLDWHQSGGRLAALELLAALQHHGVPTRLLDFSFDPFVAFWFAVESHDSTEGRVFAIDTSDKLVPRQDASRAEPWWLATQARADSPWQTRPWIWRPPPFEPRIVRQEGCFLMGGVPSTQPARNVRQGGGWRPLLRWTPLSRARLELLLLD